MRIQEILEPPNNPNLFVVKSHTDIKELEHLASKVGFRFFHLEGKVIFSKDDFFESIVDTMEFPFFGHNWNALIDCLIDLSWFSEKGFLLYYQDGDSFAQNNSQDFYNTVKAMQLAVSQRVEIEPEIPLFIVLEILFPVVLTLISDLPIIILDD